MSRKSGDLGLLENPERSLTHLSEMEELGEEILTDRQEIIALDNRRNKSREAVRALERSTDGEKAWMVMGSLLVRLPKEKAKSMLKKDQIEVNVEINKLRSDLKVKMNRLRDLEYQAPVPGLTLTPLSRQEITSIKKAMGISV